MPLPQGMKHECNHMWAEFMNQIDDRVQSPCIESCCLNDEKICLGCFRSIMEIAQWSQMNDTVRLDVLHKAETRRAKHDIKDQIKPGT